MVWGGASSKKSSCGLFVDVLLLPFDEVVEIHVEVLECAFEGDVFIVVYPIDSWFSL